MKNYLVLIIMVMVVSFVLIGSEVKAFRNNEENTETVILQEEMSYVDEEKGWF